MLRAPHEDRQKALFSRTLCVNGRNGDALKGRALLDFFRPRTGTSGLPGALPKRKPGAQPAPEGVARPVKPEMPPLTLLQGAPAPVMQPARSRTSVLLLLRGLLDGGLRLRSSLRRGLRCRLLRLLLRYHWHVSNSYVTGESAPRAFRPLHIGEFALAAQHLAPGRVMHERHAITKAL